mmetsp:Transcript_26989/g.43625  ORF Transcript_26989/g.43625 Transcript_26989/m.43625 type:complete len:168 (+) Transcript_26989:720-1223(+)
MDHNSTKYHNTLLRLEDEGLLQAGAVIVADNVLFPGSPIFLWYILRCGKYSGFTVCPVKENVHGAKLDDWMIVCKYDGEQCLRGVIDNEGADDNNGTHRPVVIPNALLELAAEVEAINTRAKRSIVNKEDWEAHVALTLNVYRKIGLRFGAKKSESDLTLDNSSTTN